MTVADQRRPTGDSQVATGAAGGSKWPRYVEAELGFSNHWHPAAFSDEVTEAGFVSVTMLGRQILLTRNDGQVQAIADQCAHRGVPFSAQPLCFLKGTVSCWYHGWTYALHDGQLVDVLTSPNSPVIGQVAIPVFAVTERQGLVFVFIGDGEPHDLNEDVPPGFLDADTHCLGIRRTVESNWRLGVENGFDTTHIFMHRNSPLVDQNNLALPYGFVPADRGAMDVHAKGWPKGVVDNLAQNYRPIFEAQLSGQSVLRNELSGDEKRVAAQVSVWLPGVLKVDPFPDPSLIQYEFYVARNATQHEYFQVLQRKVQSAEDVAAYVEEFDSRWRDLALHGFNDDDVWAREAQQDFYGNRNGWVNEHLFPPDMCITKWRQLASTHARDLARADDSQPTNAAPQ
ncbi:Rieske 2Fe-2S domain-containing protein [Mycolicibacterium sp. BiH015]|uniref:Rieske 2Fe-2S domain-containing protein n=1 Tax=Mycolicibacterium sp. BiH015 TaxID=3018808 RepID=UPI0022E71106|nr:Rieske 2Fe-2S domain-containing protein [Mycolicibacterium sp. BiH015]MDA2893259.1 Rieske 2Fe-2S domain-containing protein [Mycolicibacterium sp. BiH015]